MYFLWTLKVDEHVEKHFVATTENINLVIKRWINVYFPHANNLIIGFDSDFKETTFKFEYIGLNICFSMGKPKAIELIELS